MNENKLGSWWGKKWIKKFKMNTNRFLFVAMSIKVILNAILPKNKSKIILLILYHNLVWLYVRIFIEILIPFQSCPIKT